MPFFPPCCAHIESLAHVTHIEVSSSAPRFAQGSSHGPGSAKHRSSVANKLQRLAKVIAKKDTALTHVLAHAHVLSSLDLDQVEEHMIKNETLQLVVELNHMSTEEQIKECSQGSNPSPCRPIVSNATDGNDMCEDSVCTPSSC